LRHAPKPYLSDASDAGLRKLGGSLHTATEMTLRRHIA
jgi:hypothetical protein